MFSVVIFFVHFMLIIYFFTFLFFIIHVPSLYPLVTYVSVVSITLDAS